MDLGLTVITSLSMFAAGIGSFLAATAKSNTKIKMEIQRLELTKESKDGLAQEVAELNTISRLMNQKLDEQSNKISVLFTKLHCLQPGWKKEDC